MPEVTRLKSGKLYFSDFNEPSLDTFWTVSPSTTKQEVHSLTERPGFLRIKHAEGKEPTRILFNIPEVHSLVFEMRNEYYPSSVENEGGVCAFQEIKNTIELLEYFDDVEGVSVNYTHMRIKKQGSVYEGYGSNDGGYTWILIGTKTSREMEKLGFVLHGGANKGLVPMDVDYISVYRDSNVFVRNAEAGVRFQLYDDAGNLIDEKIGKSDTDTLRLDVTRKLIPFNGFIRTINPDGTTQDGSMKQIWGGDTFWHGVYLEFWVNNEKLDSAIDYHLGNMKNGLIEIPVEVENPSENPVRDIYLTVDNYDWYYGHQWVEIAQDSFGNPGYYRKKIYLGDIFPGERHFFWLKITRVPLEQEAQYGAYKFRITATNGELLAATPVTPTTPV